jgi:hypothetical protein
MRPDDTLLPLFLHVFGAMVLVGAAVTGVHAVLLAEGGVAESSRRLAFRTFLIVALPAWFVMRVGAEWVRIEEFGDAGVPGWAELGYMTAEGGGVLMIVSIVLAWQSARRDSRRLARIAATVMAVAVVAWVVTAWAMTAKPDL